MNMYIATREINTSERTYQAGQEVQNPSTRMIEVGAVRKVPQPGKASGQSTGKGKKEKTQAVKEPVKEPQEEILTEDSADVEVKTEE
jgi:hypothetical protein